MNLQATDYSTGWTPIPTYEAPTRSFSHASYLSDALRPERVQETVGYCVDTIDGLRQRGVAIEAIAFSGMSGALVAPIVAFQLGIPVICVRKKDDTSNHSGCEAEGAIVSSYIIVDDLVCSGHTVRYIIDTLAHSREWRGATCVGVLLYRKGDTCRGFDSVERVLQRCL